MQELASGLILLLAAHQDLAIFGQNFEFAGLKSGNRYRNQEPFGSVLSNAALDLVGRIAIGRLCNTVGTFL